ncbi:TPA: alpha-L-fucosidase, partial [bacterium]|nr:alpha-L-fucosidase [bacterium]
VCYTAKDNSVYAICREIPKGELILTAPKPTANVSVNILGVNKPLKWKHENGNFIIELPDSIAVEIPSSHACVFKLCGVE